MVMFNNTSFKLLEKSLDGLGKRHRVISNNISNVDTPGYKRKDVNFKEELSNLLENKNSLEVTNKKHISINSTDLSSFRAKVKTEEQTSIRNDKNNVSIDVEMAELAKNTLEYQALTQFVSGSFKKLDSVIAKGGKG